MTRKDRLAPSLSSAPATAEAVPLPVLAPAEEPESLPPSRPIGTWVLTGLFFVVGAAVALFITAQFNFLRGIVDLPGAYSLLGWSIFYMAAACGLAGGGRLAWVSGAALAVLTLALVLDGGWTTGFLQLVPDVPQDLIFKPTIVIALRVVGSVAILVYLLLPQVRAYFSVSPGYAAKAIAGLALVLGALTIVLNMIGHDGTFRSPFLLAPGVTVPQDEVPKPETTLPDASQPQRPQPVTVPPDAPHDRSKPIPIS